MEINVYKQKYPFFVRDISLLYQYHNTYCLNLSLGSNIEINKLKLVY
jgi:hypothetical protein